LTNPHFTNGADSRPRSSSLRRRCDALADAERAKIDEDPLG